MTETKTQELPKWFIKEGGSLYEEGSVVENRFSGEKYELTNTELSIYDYIIGSELVAFQTNDPTIINNFNKAINWFRKNNPEAYMVLLD